jgi:hypothetical protein
MGMGTPTRNQLGFVEAYLDEYDAVLRQHGAQNAVYFAAITCSGKTSAVQPV